MENSPIILNGKKVAEELYSKLPNMNGKELAIVTIGDNNASEVYVKTKIKNGLRVNLRGVHYKFKGDGEDCPEIISKLMTLNTDPNVIGIMIQKPYLKEYEALKFEDSIPMEKDVDGLGSKNMYQTLTGNTPYHYPATPKGIITLLDHYNIPIEGKNVCIINRSDIVGKPLAAMMTARNATVDLCHSHTKNLKEHTRKADIIIVAVGKAKFFDKTYITDTYHNIKGELCRKSLRFPTIIDVGTNRDKNGKLCGDVNYEDVFPYVGAITPNPGGVGPMTVLELIRNCCK